MASLCLLTALLDRNRPLFYSPFSRIGAVAEAWANYAAHHDIAEVEKIDDAVLKAMGK